jgi:hypothetical protein
VFLGTAAHTHILLVHVAIKMRMGFISKPCALRYCRIAIQKHFEVTAEVNCSGFIGLKKGLLHFNFVWNSFASS